MDCDRHAHDQLPATADLVIYHPVKGSVSLVLFEPRFSSAEGAIHLMLVISHPDVITGAVHLMIAPLPGPVLILRFPPSARARYFMF